MLKSNTRVKAFTLAEVLITLGIIGVVAALTLPTLTKKIGQIQRTIQFKKAYAELTNAWQLAVNDFGYYPQCGYWSTRPAHLQSVVVVTYVNENTGEKYWRQRLADGTETSLPSDWNGRMKECSAFGRAILNHLKIVKTCNGHAYRDGCIADIAGNDTIYRENHPNDELSDMDVITATSGSGGWRKSSLLNNSRAYMLAGNKTLISYSSSFSPSIFAVDINGLAGPNKWGYDIFAFSTSISPVDGQTLIITAGSMTEKGGVSTSTMLNKLRKSIKN